MNFCVVLLIKYLHNEEKIYMCIGELYNLLQNKYFMSNSQLDYTVWL